MAVVERELINIYTNGEEEESTTLTQSAPDYDQAEMPYDLIQPEPILNPIKLKRLPEVIDPDSLTRSNLFLSEADQKRLARNSIDVALAIDEHTRRFKSDLVDLSGWPLIKKMGSLVDKAFSLGSITISIPISNTNSERSLRPSLPYDFDLDE